METLSLKAFAKINLTLDVLRKRIDGYHEVEMIMQTIDLYDQLTLTKQEKGISISCNNPAVPCDERNLAYQAFQMLKRKYNFSGGLVIDIKKNIPVAAGLAGGSSDAAAVLKGADLLYNLQITPDRLLELGAELGSDIPFCLTGGTVLAQGRGELISSLTPMPEIWLILANPLFQVATAEVYRYYSPEKVKNRPDNQQMIRAIDKKDYREIVNQIENVLEPITVGLYPRLLELKWLLEKLSLSKIFMTGSGPTWVGVAENKKLASDAVSQLQNKIPWVKLSRTINPK